MKSEARDAAERRLDGLLCELSKELGRHWNNPTRAWNHVCAIRGAIGDVISAHRTEASGVHSDF